MFDVEARLPSTCMNLHTIFNFKLASVQNHSQLTSQFEFEFDQNVACCGLEKAAGSSTFGANVLQSEMQ